MQSSTGNAAIDNKNRHFQNSDVALDLDHLLFKQLANQAPVIMWITGANGECIFLNQKWYDYTGQSPAKGLAMGWLEAVHPDDRGSAEKTFIADRNSIRSIDLNLEYRLKSKTGEYRWMVDRGSPIVDETGLLVGYVGTVVDIHDRKLAEEEAKANEARYRESESRFRKLVHGLPVAVSVVDQDGNFEVANNEALRMWGIDSVEGVKWWGAYKVRTVDGLEIPEQDYAIRRAFDEQRAFVEEVVVEKQDGQFVFVLLYPQPIYNNTGQCVGAMCVAVDITDRKHAEQELERLMTELEKNVDERTSALKRSNDALIRTNLQLEQYAYVASHDLQEPLRKIQTFISILNRKLDNTEVAKNYLSKIDLSAQRMSSLIRDVLNYSRLQKANTEFVTVDLNEILKDVVTDYELLVAQKRAVIKSGALPVIKGNRLQLTQLFSNLISNSLKFSDKKPVIEINAKVLAPHEKPASPALEHYADYFELSFSDNGIGFNEKYVERIFAIFQRLNQRNEFTGTGIGLALCKKIAENHKGMITASSKEGVGSTFKVYLPVYLIEGVFTVGK